MNREPSLSSSRPPAASRPSFARRATRRLSTVSSLGGQDDIVVPAEQAITEEIAEIKRYEDFTTIDWVQDAAREQVRRRTRRRDTFFHRNGVWSWRRKVWESYDAAQAWVVVTIVAIVIGLTAAALNIITEYLSDIKLGYCTTSWYLNEGFCCYGAEDGCEEWNRWSSWGFVNYIVYTIFALTLAFIAAFLVKEYAPYAAGSGISEIKCIIAGFVMKGFLGFWTFLIKSICLPLAIASGLSVGKEGPSVHYAVCVGNIVSRYFDKYKQSASKTREILTATAATGVAVAFGSPIGGVLFSLEEMSSHFPLKTLWRSFFCALVATAVLSAMNPFRTGQLVMFSVKYDRDWHFFEIIFYVVLGVFGGLYGAFMIKWNLKVQALRKKHLAKYPIQEAVFLAGITALLCYPNQFLRIDMTEMMEILFRECEGDYDYNGICEAQNRWPTAFSLLIATLLRAFLVIISYGCKVPAGIFVPSMAIGASFGRMVGILVQWLHESFPDARLFSACQPDVPCITPGTYAFLGAGAALSGIMHITISVTVIMFELTGALTYILPTMIVVGVTKAIGDRLSNGGIADRMIWFNGFPFLDNKEEHSFGVPASRVMTRNVRMLPSSGMEIKAAQELLEGTNFSGFPIVEDFVEKILIGYIGRTELQYAIDKAKKQDFVALNARISFISTDDTANESPTTVQGTSSTSSTTFDSMGLSKVDFSLYVDTTPITVHPRLPLETTMELFKKMGPKVIIVEHQGKLEGLVTVKDCLKYQFKVEASEHHHHRQQAPINTATTQPSGNNDSSLVSEILERTSDWFAHRIDALSRGKLKLPPIVVSGNRRSRHRTGWTSINSVSSGDGGRDDHGETRGPSDPADDYRHENEFLDRDVDGDGHEIEDLGDPVDHPGRDRDGDDVQMDFR